MVLAFELAADPAGFGRAMSGAAITRKARLRRAAIVTPAIALIIIAAAVSRGIDGICLANTEASPMAAIVKAVIAVTHLEDGATRRVPRTKAAWHGAIVTSEQRCQAKVVVTEIATSPQ
jgi:hypothetical protein